MLERWKIKEYFDPGEEHRDSNPFSGHPDSGAALPGVGVESSWEGLAGCSGKQTAALLGMGVEARGEGLAGCSGTQAAALSEV